MPPPPQWQRPPAPPSIQNAVKCMWAGAALSVIGIIAEIASQHEIRTLIEKANPKLSAAKLTTDVHAATIAAVVVGLIGVGLWLWMAKATGNGHRWARITGTVFFALDTLSLLSDLSGHSDPIFAEILAVLTWLAGLGAVFLLWQRESSLYFSAPQY